MLFTTDNAQQLIQKTTINPLTESFTLEEGIFTAGEDIPEGIYDIVLPEAELNEYIWFGLDLSYPNGSLKYLWASNNNGEPEQRIRNVIIPDGTEFTLDGDPIELVPSEGYFETDLSEYPRN